MMLSAVLRHFTGANLRVLLPELRAALVTSVLRASLVVSTADDQATRRRALSDCSAVVQDEAWLRWRAKADWASSGAYLLTMDADLSHLPSVVSTLWRQRERADVVIASRYVEGGSAEMPWLDAYSARSSIRCSAAAVSGQGHVEWIPSVRREAIGALDELHWTSTSFRPCSSEPMPKVGAWSRCRLLTGRADTAGPMRECSDSPRVLVASCPCGS